MVKLPINCALLHRTSAVRNARRLCIGRASSRVWKREICCHLVPARTRSCLDRHGKCTRYNYKHLQVKLRTSGRQTNSVNGTSGRPTFFTNPSTKIGAFEGLGVSLGSHPLPPKKRDRGGLRGG